MCVVLAERYSAAYGDGMVTLHDGEDTVVIPYETFMRLFRDIKRRHRQARGHGPNYRRPLTQTELDAIKNAALCGG